jgi:hypothetical protein
MFQNDINLTSIPYSAGKIRDDEQRQGVPVLQIRKIQSIINR